jgi:beta-glucosidase
MVIGTPARSPVKVYMGCGDDCVRAVDVTRMFAAYEPGKRQTVSLPLQCFVKPGADLAHVDVPFGVLASPPFSAAFANVRIVAGAENGTDAACPESAAR